MFVNEKNVNFQNVNLKVKHLYYLSKYDILFVYLLMGEIFDMDVNLVYKKYLRKYRGNKHKALRSAMCEITKYTRFATVDESFMKEYHNAKRHLMILNVIAPGLVFGLSTGSIVYLFDSDLPLPVIVLLGITLFYFITVAWYGRRERCVLLPHLIRMMEERIDKHIEKTTCEKTRVKIRISEKF